MRRILFLILPFFFPAGAVFAAPLTVFTDRPLFGSVSDPLTVETFENSPVIGTPDGGGVFKQGFADFKGSVQQPYPAIKLLDEPVFGAGNTTPHGSHYLYLDTDRSSQGSLLRISFKYPVWGAGFSYSQLSARETKAFVTVGRESFSLVLNPYDVSPGEFHPLFWGVLSNRPFSRLIIDSGIDSGFGIDDFLLVGPPPDAVSPGDSVPVPEPTSLFFLAAGLGAAVFLHRRIRKPRG